MTADLTCEACRGVGWVDRPGNGDTRVRYRCYEGCIVGRRQPTLAEWDALVADNERLCEALQAMRDSYRRSSDSWRPDREFPTDYSRGWHDGHHTALAGHSIAARRALDPDAAAEDDELQTIACHGTDEEWYRKTGHCGGCGTIADSCECKGECGCWEAHGPPPEPWESPLDRAVRERDALVAERARYWGHLRNLLAVHDEDCRYDHHGNCQAHYIEQPCRVASARAALDREAP